jgi:hypothetical protein
MTPRRILLVSINVALVAALWPAAMDLATRGPSPDTPLKRRAVSPPVLKQRPEPADLSRSLFRSGSPPVEEDAEAPAAESSSIIRLLGIIITDESRIAVLERDGAVMRVQEDDDIGGWQIAEIATRKIRLENEEQNLEIPLDKPADAR